PDSSTPSTASRPIPRGISTRPKPTTAAACSGSCTRGCSRSRRVKIKGRCGHAGPVRADAIGIRESGFWIRRDSLDVNRFERESRIPNPEARPTRRDFLAASLLFPAALWPQSAAARFLATVPLGGVAGVPTTPLGTLLGSGLDARLFTDLSTIDPRDPK